MSSFNPVNFVHESWQELKKATWLPRDQAVSSTIAIMLFIAFLAVYAGGIDWILSVVIGALLGGPL